MKFLFKLLIVPFIFVACSTTKKIENATVNMPHDFREKSDSTNSALVAYKTFLSDTHLVKLIDEAIKNNIDYNIALQRIQASKAAHLAKKGLLFPSVGVTVSAAQRKYGLYTMDGAGNISTYMRPGEIVPTHLRDFFVGFQASWEADIWGKLHNRKKAALNRYLGSIEGKNFIITSLIAEVAMSYYELLALDNTLEILDETIALQENAVTLVKAQKQAGKVNELAVNQLETQLLGTRSLQAEIKQKLVIAENSMNTLLGKFPSPIKREKKSLYLLDQNEIKLGNPTDLLKNRPDIRQKEFEMYAAHADVKAAKRAFYPSLNLTSAYGYQAYKTGLLFLTPESIAYSLLGNLIAPLINRTALKAELKTANSAQLESVYNYRKNVINAYVEVINERNAIKNLRSILEFRAEQANIAMESVSISTDLFKTGKATYIEVLLSQQNALEAKLEHINARKQNLNAYINLYKALGGGWR